MPPKPSTSNRGRSWAALHRGPRGRVCRYFRGARGPRERSPWTREPRPLHFRLSGGLGRKKSRFRKRKARSGEDLAMARGPFGEVPKPPEPTPLDSALSRPNRLLGAWEAICIACAFGTHSFIHWDPLLLLCVAWRCELCWRGLCWRGLQKMCGNCVLARDSSLHALPLHLPIKF
jgi:hypothetical protein